PLLSVLYILIIFTYLLTIIYSILLNRIKNVVAFAYIQIIGDLIFDTVLVYLTRGIESPFIFLYSLTIIMAGIVLFRMGSFVAASLSSLLFVSMCIFQINKIKLLPIPDYYVNPITPYSFWELFLKIFLSIAAFYLVAFFAGVLLENLKKTHQELEEKEGTLKKLERLNENILQSLSNGIITTDLNGKIISFNAAAEKIFGIDSYAAIGKHWNEILPTIPYIESLKRLSHSSSGIISEEIELLINGAKKNISFSLFPLKDEDGNNTGMIGNFEDITEVKRMEESLKRADRLAAIGEVAAGMAHEIRNPLASISGSIQMLKDTIKTDGKNKKLMDISIKESERLDHIINNFLQYARPGQPKFEKCDAAKIIEDVITLVKNSPKFTNKKINFNFKQNNEKIFINADSKQLEQVLWNLSINSIEAIEKEGNVEISLSKDENNTNSHSLGKNRSFAKITFSDDGEGIKKEDMGKIFSPFYTTKEGGTGLGLAIVYRIIEEHFGRIEIDETNEKGTKFFIYLPIAE
ncbi:MAG: PAS domain S-box protein, partial [Candidatus Schekmanbacteria bacterium]